VAGENADREVFVGYWNGDKEDPVIISFPKEDDSVKWQLCKVEITPIHSNRSTNTETNKLRREVNRFCKGSTSLNKSISNLSKTLKKGKLI